jgi:DNA-binding NtrC family response regulator
MMSAETETNSRRDRGLVTRAGPGVLLIFTAGKGTLVPFPLQSGRIELQRSLLEKVNLTDGHLSRNHARVSLDGASWTVEDLGSKNATFVDGVMTRTSVTGKDLRTVRVGESIFLLVNEIAPYLHEQPTGRSQIVRGPILRDLWDLIAGFATRSQTLHITGESGAGKELAARAFHDASPHHAGPFIPVNCAAIPVGVAERLLFGARKGAYSGAVADVEGYLQNADGGTLFLDEIGDLDLDVQAKLLRVLELREVTPLGGTRPRKVDFVLCSATHRDLRELVAAQRFRADLLYRIAAPSVAIPPLRDRLDEVGFHVTRAVARVDDALTASASLVEMCLQRRWPGNVRELIATVQNAAEIARTRKIFLVDDAFLAENAGRELAASPSSPGGRKVRNALPGDEEIEDALRRANGRVVAAARLQGLHRNQLRRWVMKKRYPQPVDDEDELDS